MAIDVPINVDVMMTWKSFSQTCYDAIISACCNIDSYKGVPARLQTGEGQLAVRTWSGIGVSGSTSTWSATWYANPENLISTVSSSTVNSEWNTFLDAAGVPTTIDPNTGKSCRSDKVIQAKEFSLLIGLYMQFMAYHLKPVYSRRQIYNTVEAQAVFQGTKYVTGTVTPNYVLTAIEPGNIPEINNSDIVNIVDKNFGKGSTTSDPNIFFRAYDTPSFARYYLS